MGPRWLKITGLLIFSILLVVNTCLLWRGERMLTRLESNLDTHSNQLASMESPVSGELPDNLKFLNTRVQLLAGFISDLEVKLTSLKGLAEAAEVEVLAARGSSDVNAAQSTKTVTANTEPPKDDLIAHDNTKQVTRTGENTGSIQVPAVITDQGPWVINVASLDNQAAADRFSTRAHAQGVPVQHQVVTVNGKQRWRIQVTGFSSPTEARINAGPIKEKLGLKSIWISQR